MTSHLPSCPRSPHSRHLWPFRSQIHQPQRWVKKQVKTLAVFDGCLEFGDFIFFGFFGGGNKKTNKQKTTSTFCSSMFKFFFRDKYIYIYYQYIYYIYIQKTRFRIPTPASKWNEFFFEKNLPQGTLLWATPTPGWGSRSPSSSLASNLEL